jgi:hypothetical protein
MNATRQYELQIDSRCDENELDELTRHLLSEIRPREVETVALKTAPTDLTGRKSGEAVNIGAIIVTILPAALPGLIAFLKEWCMRSKDRSIKIIRRSGDQQIELEFNLDGIAKNEIDALIDTANHGIK